MLRAFGFGGSRGACVSVGPLGVCVSYGYSWTDENGVTHSI